MGLTVGVVYAAMGVLARCPAALGRWRATAGRPPTGYGRSSVSVVGVVDRRLRGGAGPRWWGLLRLYDLNPYFAKTPADVWTFLTTASDDRSDMWSAFGTTIVDTAVGFAIGLAAAVIVSAASVAWSAVNWVVTPSAVALRSIPIIAMTPLIALIFGRDLMAVTVIVGLVTFFPTFVALTTAMRDAPAQACDLIAAYGGSAVRELVGVRLPFALPALFAACKIALPAALSGALLAEWLATGQGLGQPDVAGDRLVAVRPRLVRFDDHRRRLGVRLRARRDRRITRRPASWHRWSDVTLPALPGSTERLGRCTTL